MEIEGTQLYNKNKKKLYPYSYAEVTNTSGDVTVNNKNNVQDCLVDLYSQVAALSGSQEAVNSIRIEVKYCRLAGKTVAEAAESTTWQNAFLLPNAETPYTWKRTVITYTGDTSGGNTFYEIVATDMADKTQTIYRATSTSEAPTIEYKTDIDGNIDLESIPEDWDEKPVSISPSTPYVFMATRKRVDGVWEKFSEPAQYGRWAFDSKLELRYQITDIDTIPTLESKADNPGDDWKTTTPSTFTGKLWMITATSVNEVLNADKDGNKWFGPHLISIIQ